MANAVIEHRALDGTATGRLSTEEIEQLAELMRSHFRGRSNKIAFQTEANQYYPIYRDYHAALKQHLSFSKTIGVYLMDESRHVRLMAFDIDNHAPEYCSWDEYELIQSKILPLVHFYEKFGIAENQILIENTGAGFHVFFRLEDAIPVADAVDFLKRGAEEYDIKEYFPATSRHVKLGKLIRLPLGVHRERYHKNPERAESRLCKIENGMVVSLLSHEDTVARLTAWTPVTHQQIEHVLSLVEPCRIVPVQPVPVAQCPGSIVTVAVPVQSGNIACIRENEKRACITHLLTHKTQKGYRGRTAFNLALYLRWVLLLEKHTVWNLLDEWRRTLTVPVYEIEDLKKNFEGACSDKYRNWPICMKNSTMLRVCRSCCLAGSCNYTNNKMPRPMNDKRAFALLDHSKRAEDAILLSLHIIYHFKAEHPFRGNGWFRTDKYEIVRSSKSKSGKKEFKVSEYSVSKSKLDILVERGDIEYESVAGSRFFWVKLVSCDCFRQAWM